LLRRPEVSYANVVAALDQDLGEVDFHVREQVEIAAKYQGYIDRQIEDVKRGKTQENAALPADLDYATIHGLPIEAQQKLNAQKPETIGQASRISGITPAAISLLLVHLKRRNKNKKNDRAA
jgi:tRNA uridine 5-carboxymethylaminomethyl modification enzyme